MFTTIIRATVVSLIIGAGVHEASAAKLAPTGLIISRNPSGRAISARTIGGNAPSGAKTGNNLKLKEPGSSNQYHSPQGNNFFLGNSVNSQNVGNARQGGVARPVTSQPVCNGKGLCWSDLRLKRDVEPVAHLSNGLSLYRYRYMWGSRLYVGVVAQEVAEILPGAVRLTHGYLRVDYRMLGLRLQTWERWQQGRDFLRL